MTNILDPQPTVTPAQRNAALGVLLAVAEAIRELGSVPSGHLYARLLPAMPNMTTDQYQQMIDSLKRAGLVEERAHELFWVGPHLT